MPVSYQGRVARVIVYSDPVSAIAHDVATVRHEILVAGGIALLLALIGGYCSPACWRGGSSGWSGPRARSPPGEFAEPIPVGSRDELGQLARAFNDMQRQLAQLDQARKRFIATASHELRTPIFSLGGLRRAAGGRGARPETRRRFLEQVRDQVERLRKLSVDLLDLSRLESGSLELRPEQVDLGELARSVSGEFEPALAAHDSHLELRLPARPMEAFCDPVRVAQILRILLDNALTHTPARHASWSPPAQDGRVRLAVRDDGERDRRRRRRRGSSSPSTPPAARGAPGSGWRSPPSSPSGWRRRWASLAAGRDRVHPRAARLSSRRPGAAIGSDVLRSSARALLRSAGVPRARRPELGARRRAVGDGAGGDVTFAVDELAEASWRSSSPSAAPGGWPTTPRIAGWCPRRRRHARADRRSDRRDAAGDGRAGVGLRGGGARAAGRRRAGDARPRRAGCVVEIKTGDWFLARRGAGVPSIRRVRVSANARGGRGCSGATGFAAGPARPTVEVLGELIDASSVGGGTFELGSQAFVMTRVVTGQLDAVVEVGSRMIDEVPGLRAEFERIGAGQVLNNSPYDLAAPWLCVVEAGGVVSDGWGEPLDGSRLLGSGHEFQMSSITAGTAAPRPAGGRRSTPGSPGCERERARRAVRGGLDAERRRARRRRVARPPPCSSPSPSPTSTSPTTRASSDARWSTRSASGPSGCKGLRVVHLSATAFGGGVSEILYTLVPLMADVGIEVRVAGDLRARGVLQRHEGDAQRAAG